MHEDPDPPIDAPAPETAAKSAAPIAELSPAACAARLAELFPAVFAPGAAKPLKLRIQGDIQLRASGIFTRKALSAHLHRHTTSTAYLRALVNSPQRIDLDGAAAGEVATEHREAAAAELQRRRALHDARRAAEREAEREAHRNAQRTERAAHDEARRARAAQDEQRRKRQALLCAFEASTLSRSNFCALKGISEADLDALLARARQEPAVPEGAALGYRNGANAPGTDAPPRSRQSPHRNWKNP